VSFQDKVRAASEANNSRIVLALDLESPEPSELRRKSEELLQKVAEHVCAVKINRQLVLSLGLRGGVDCIVEVAHEHSLPVIMDAKLNDVRHTNEFMMRAYTDAGFDAIIASPVAGWEGGLDAVFNLAASQGKGVLLLVYMSSPGADKFYSLKVSRNDEKPKELFELLAEMAIDWKADGVIVGATKPQVIRRVRQLSGPRMDIYSPGVGTQGGDAREAIDAGSSYLIVGRSIYQAANPAKVAREYRDLTS